jgi:hypothetical protein
MAQSLTWYPSLARFFPRDDPLARLMARLFVLWQDLLYEHAGILDDEGFPTLDGKGNGHIQRRLYFLRANSRTLCSAKYLFDALVANSTFAGWLKEDPVLAADFVGAKKAFDQHRTTIERVRNTVGAHAEESLGDAIVEFEPGDTARFEIHSEDFMRPHFATQILLAAMTRGASREKDAWLETYRATVGPLAHATNAMITAMSAVAGVYVTRFKLLPE